MTCWNCETSHIVEVPAVGWKAWRSGELIQDALPELNADNRELLMSGTCGDCWELFFPEDEEDEEDEACGRPVFDTANMVADP